MESERRKVYVEVNVTHRPDTLHSSIVIQSFLLILSMKKAVDHN